MQTVLSVDMQKNSVQCVGGVGGEGRMGELTASLGKSQLEIPINIPLFHIFLKIELKFT